MDTDTWLSSFRLKILNTEMNCFDGLFQFSPLGEISYPNHLLMKLLWPKSYSNDSSSKLKSCCIETSQTIKWMTDFPSYWNELRTLAHCGIKSILTTQKCPKLIIDTLKDDGEKITCIEFKQFWMEIYKALAHDPTILGTNSNTCTKEVPKIGDPHIRVTKVDKEKNPSNKLNYNQLYSKQPQKSKKSFKINENPDEWNQETMYLHSQNQENQWKIQVIKDTSSKLRKNFNKLNFAYLFLRNYNIFNLSELIRKNLKIECSRPTKFNYYNILENDRIYQANQKLVKGIIRQYKYKRRTRAMSADDNDSTIWTLNKTNKLDNMNDKENDKINIICAIKTAIMNCNRKELLRLSIDKRMKLLNVNELQKIGYFKAIQSDETNKDGKEEDMEQLKKNDNDEKNQKEDNKK